MKTFVFRNFRRVSVLMAVFVLIAATSCKKEVVVEDPIASFQFEVSQDNYLEVSFTNYSQHAESYSWNFGDGNSSTEENPTHVYDAAGSYQVVLTATNSEGTTANYSQDIEITDPLAAQTILDGGSSKTWKLLRDGVCLGVGPDADGARSWWALENDGSRPCVFYHEFTFNRDGSFVFEDNNIFWGETAVFAGTDFNEICFEPTAANMINSNGDDVSAWMSGTHQFTYDPTVGEITLTGNGAWMGMPQLGTSAESIVPEASRTFKAILEEMDGYDVLTVVYAYADLYWDFTYVSYDDPSMEPEVVTEQDEYGEDLDDFAPTEFYNTFNSTSDDDVKYLFPTESAVTITAGVDDPADAAGAKVGEYVRGVDMYADLKFAMDFDIQFDNFTTVSIDVYIPSSNTYEEGGLTKGIQLWIADMSQTQEFWTSWCQYDVDPETIPLDEWKTYTFDLETPSAGVGTPKTRTDLDLVGLVIGGSGHAVDGTFYIRNLRFN